jgi:hypothetical protein
LLMISNTCGPCGWTEMCSIKLAVRISAKLSYLPTLKRT